MESKVWLLIPEKSGRRPFALRFFPVVVGRAPECDICIDDVTVSKRHIEFRGSGNILQMEDMGSSNGSKLNGLDITGQEASLEPVEYKGLFELTKGVKLELGTTVSYLHHVTAAQGTAIMELYVPKDEQWFFLLDGERVGPVTEEELLCAANKGIILPDDSLWRGDRDEPLTARNVEGLFPA